VKKVEQLLGFAIVLVLMAGFGFEKCSTMPKNAVLWGDKEFWDRQVKRQGDNAEPPSKIWTLLSKLPQIEEQ
jgi:hypothetical protein